MIKNFEDYIDALFEMATIKKDNFWDGNHYRVAVHGPANNTLNTPKDRPIPHIHIYLTQDVPPYSLFDFEVSLVDVFMKCEYSLISQKDKTTKNKFIGKRENGACSWDGYKGIRDGLKTLIEKQVSIEKNDVPCIDNLQYCIETYNEESNVMSANPFIDYIKEHCIADINAVIFRNNLKKYYPETYAEWCDSKIIKPL